MRPAAAVTLVVMWFGCNGATSTVTLGTHGLAPHSSILTDTSFGISTVLITDVKNYCSELVAAAPVSPSCNAPPPKPYEPNGSFFVLRLAAPFPGNKYVIGNSLESTFASRSPDVLVDYFNRATKGEAQLVDYEAGKRISGTYSLTFPRDGDTEGTFEAEACDISRVAEAAKKTRACSFSASDAGVDACNRQCLCDIAGVGASCTFNSSANNWSCLCSSPTFQTSTCVMNTRPDCSSDTGTCCNLDF